MPENTRLLVQPSRRYAIILCVVMVSFAALLIFGPGKIPLLAKIISGLIAGGAVIATVKGLASGKPLVIADADGIQDRRLGKTVIRWADIRAFRHVPRVEKAIHRRKHFTLFEEWRPVQLWIDAPEDTAFTRLHRLKPAPRHPNFPEALYLEIRFEGTNTPSSQFIDFIRQRAPTAIEIEGSEMP